MREQSCEPLGTMGPWPYAALHLRESGTLALIVPKRLFWYIDSYIQRSDCLLHRCWTRRRHDPDQSNPNPSLARTSSDFFGQTYEANDVALETVYDTGRPPGPQPAQPRVLTAVQANAGLSASSSEADGIEATRGGVNSHRAQSFFTRAGLPPGVLPS